MKPWITPSCLLLLTAPSARGLDLPASAAVFRRARELALRDAGALWGRSLDGPILLVDPVTLRVAANQADATGCLKLHSGVFVGSLPAGTPVANTAMAWSGIRWTMLLEPSVAGLKGAELDTLLMHESWHRIQAELGLLPPGRTCDHLDDEAGRVSLRLELRALARALRAEGTAREEAFRDALAFREERYRRFPGARAAEASLEMNEGLAQFTGLRLAFAGREAEAQAAADLERADGHPRFARSFAYWTGPAYAFLLDDIAPGWRARAPRVLAFGGLLPQAWNPPEAERAARAGVAYGAAEIQAQEHRVAEARVVRVAELRGCFLERPVLRLPGPLQISFDPNGQETLPGLGVHYPQLQAKGPWGHLKVRTGGLVAPDWSSLTVPAQPSGAPGAGCELVLNPGWERVPGPRQGEWIVQPARGTQAR